MFVMGKERDYIIHDENNVKGFFGPYRFLSNFEVADIWYEGMKFASTEHAYQAAKSTDESIRQEFFHIKCSEAQKLGQKIECRSDWEDVKLRVMFDVCWDKFTRHEELKQKLLATGDKYLEETNHWKDVFWGICNGKGKNNLGQILMRIREKLSK